MKGLDISPIRERETSGTLPIRPRVILRLVVVLPDMDMREAPLAQRLCALAAQGVAHGTTSNFADVLLLSVCDSWVNESPIRLRLALLMALLHDAGLNVSTDVRVNADWPTWLQSLHQPGDLVVCFAEHVLAPPHLLAISNPAARPQRLYQHLSALHFAATELLGYCISPKNPSSWRDGVRHWVAPLSIVVLLLIFQIFLVQWTRDWQDWTRKTAFILTIILELATVAKFSM